MNRFATVVRKDCASDLRSSPLATISRIEHGELAVDTSFSGSEPFGDFLVTAFQRS
jgi:hypothetical protein